MPSSSGSVHVATTTRRVTDKVYRTYLLCRSHREDGTVKHQTVGNISHLPPDLIDTSLGLTLDLELASPRQLHEALDWLAERQKRIENKLATKHLRDGSLTLYDVSSRFHTGTHCNFATFGHNRNGKNGYLQIVYGLLCDADGCPIAVEVFQGNTSDPNTLQSQIDKIRKRFRLERVIMVGDRGMLTSKHFILEITGTASRIAAMKRRSLRNPRWMGFASSGRRSPKASSQPHRRYAHTRISRRSSVPSVA